MTIKFAKKDVNFEVVYDYYSMDVTGISVDPIYTLGEKMEKAGLNTVISMAVVFAVLILISLLISCFKIFPLSGEKESCQSSRTGSTAGRDTSRSTGTCPCCSTDR